MLRVTVYCPCLIVHWEGEEALKYPLESVIFRGTMKSDTGGEIGAKKLDIELQFNTLGWVKTQNRASQMEIASSFLPI